MDTILKLFWYGKINPQEESMEKNNEIKGLLNLTERNRIVLYNSMTATQRETLEKYEDCIHEMHDIMNFEIFSYAFRLGGKLMLATLLDHTSEE